MKKFNSRVEKAEKGKQYFFDSFDLALCLIPVLSVLALCAAAAALFGACNMPSLGTPIPYSMTEELNNEDDTDFASFFSAGEAAGVLTVRGVETGKICDWAISRSAAVTTYDAWKAAVGEKNTYIGGRATAVDDALQVELKNGGLAFIGSGAFLVTVKVSLREGAAPEEVYYWESAPFDGGNAALSVGAAKSRNKELLGGAVSFGEALAEIQAGKSGSFLLTPESEIVDAYFDSYFGAYFEGSLRTVSAGDITIDGNGKTVTLAQTGSLLTLTGAGAALTLKNITLEGPSAVNNAPLITISGGTLTLDSGAVLTGNTASVTPGIRVEGGGGLVMKAGSLVTRMIAAAPAGGESEGGGGESEDGGGPAVVGVFSAGNRHYGGEETGGEEAGFEVDGGAVYIAYGGVFTLSGGKITGSSASRGGGVYADGTFHIGKGSAVTGNLAEAAGGGGVYFTEAAMTALKYYPAYLDTVVLGNRPDEHNWLIRGGQ
ncbi:MAG: hypothetical protein LBQ44_05025 [Treponema sp.]|nr:hypothetical protein [Treponema sp.]